MPTAWRPAGGDSAGRAAPASRGLRRSMRGLGRSSTRVMPSVRSGMYAPGGMVDFSSGQRASPVPAASWKKSRRTQFLCYSLGFSLFFPYPEGLLLL